MVKINVEGVVKEYSPDEAYELLKKDLFAKVVMESPVECVPKSTADALAEALENARNTIECGWFNTKGKTSDNYYRAMKKIDAALAAYRKGE